MPTSEPVERNDNLDAVRGFIHDLVLTAIIAVPLLGLSAGIAVRLFYWAAGR